MRRRKAVIAGLSLSIIPFASAPQTRVFRIGVLSHYIPRERFTLLPAALRQLGYEEGRNTVYEYRFAEARSERLPALAAELVSSKVDVIVAGLNPEIQAAKQASSKIPIVMIYALNPVESGLVASLARPGSNVTGTTLDDPEGAGKKLEILRDAVPRLSRVALLWEPEFAGMEPYVREVERVAQAMGIQLTLVAVRSLDELDAALANLATHRPDALYVAPTGALFTHRARVIDFAARQRVPAMYINKGSVVEGGLMAYLPDQRALIFRTAVIIDRILKGATPGDIPVEQPSRYELIINIKAARELGLALPPSLLLRADELVQ